MLSCTRRTVRRWPRVVAALMLAVLGAQGFAATLSWCLHGDAPQVVNAVEACHGAGAAAGDLPAGDLPAPQVHIEAAPDASSAKLPGVAGTAGPPPVLCRLRVDSASWSGGATSLAAADPCRARPDLGPACGLAPRGHSARLLI